MGKQQHITESNQLLALIYQQKINLLKSVLEDFKLLELQPRIGIEIEFYLQYQGLAAHNPLVTKFIFQLKIAIKKNNIDILNIEPEQGLGQIEIKTSPYFNLKQLCQDIIKIKQIISHIAKNLNCHANFLSQPYENDCGSALQINLSLINNNNNLFTKPNSLYLFNTISSLLNYTKNIMIIFSPRTEDYLRFNLVTNQNLFKNRKYSAPVNISWGYENRTTLIRIPSSKNQRRLEFRLAASNADIYLSITFFLLTILDGINNGDNKPILPIYGNAFDEQYKLEKLPQNYQIAYNYFFKKNKILDMVKTKLNTNL